MSLNIPLKGGCLCGKLRYSLSALPLAVFACHCRNCQVRSGSAFSLSMLTLRRDFEIVEGDSITRVSAGGSGNFHIQHFCEHCLTRTHGESEEYPYVINVRPGTLDQPADITPVAQIWTSRALPWAVSSVIQCFEENPPDVPALIEEWRIAARPPYGM